MSGFMEFHNTNWDYVVQFSKDTGAQIVVDVDDETINKYVHKYDCAAFKKPSSVLINPARNRFIIFSPRTLDRYLILREERTIKIEVQAVRYELIIGFLTTTWVGRLAMWWCNRKRKIFMPDPMSTVLDILNGKYDIGDKDEPRQPPS